MTDSEEQLEPIFGDPLKDEKEKSAEEVLDDMIKQATQGDQSSDEEYISAEEDEDDVENLEVLKTVMEDINVSGNAKDPMVTQDVKRHDEEDESPEKKDEDDKEEESGFEKEDDGKSEDIDELKEREEKEKLLTEEERMERRENSQKLKDNGNIEFRNGNYDDAITEYTKALDICPLMFHKERSIMFANRGACKMKKEAYEDAISDSTSAIDLHPQYMKAILRRAELYEKTEKLDEALKDYEAILKLDPGHDMARCACMRLQQAINERNEKLKTEMMGKLKELGNLVLRPFGLSTNNFQLQQDPSTGSYSVNFQQNPTGNGS